MMSGLVNIMPNKSMRPYEPSRGGMAPRRAPAISGIGVADQKPFVALCLLLVLAFLLGGSARADVPQLVVLRPAAILILGYGLWGLSWEQVKAFRYPFGVAAAMLILVAMQLVPLPPAIWSHLPGREIIADIDRTAGLGTVWRPVSLVPAGTWNSLFAMLVPLAALVLGARITPEQRRQLLPLILVLGLLSSLIGLAQIFGPDDGPLYLFRITNPGFAVGLFANRNHQAIFLASLFPMLAVFASLPWRSEGAWAMPAPLLPAAAFGILLIPMILVAGSRAGLLIGALGIGACALLYRPPVPATSARGSAARGGRGILSRAAPGPGLSFARWQLVGLATALVAALTLATIAMGRAEALRRIIVGDGVEDFRFRAWSTVWKITEKYFPIGSGAGSFTEVFQIDEPRALLATTYFNHAHNDWIEVILTGGLTGLLLLIFACLLVGMRAVQLARRAGKMQTRDELFARLGVVFVVQLAMASAGDYPLRTPALACVFALAVLWAAAPLKSISGRPIRE